MIRSFATIGSGLLCLAVAAYASGAEKIAFHPQPAAASGSPASSTASSTTSSTTAPTDSNARPAGHWLRTSCLHQSTDSSGLASPKSAALLRGNRRRMVSPCLSRLARRIPSVDEVERFQQTIAAGSKAETWSIACCRTNTSKSTPATGPRSGRTPDRPHGSTERNVRWSTARGCRSISATRFARNKPYDQMVYELVTATGANKPGEEDFNGAVNFLVDKLEENGVQATAKTSQDLPRPASAMHAVPQPSVQRMEAEPVLGVERLLPPDASRATFEGGRDVANRSSLINQDFAGEGQQARRSRCCSTSCATALSKVAYPVFVDGTEIERQRLCRTMSIAATELAKLIVNSRLPGQGDRQPHVGPLPRLRLHQADRRHGPAQCRRRIRSCSTAWAKEFATHSYDLKELIRWIVLSEPYGLSSKIDAKQQEGRPGAGREADVQPLLPAADAGRRAVRIAAGGHRGRQDARQLRRAGEDQDATGCSSSRSPSAPTKTTKPRRSTARFRRR